MKQLTELVTDKDVFDYVSLFLINQNKKSELKEIGCAYRGLDGEKCAIGCIISNDSYSENLESLTVYDQKIQWAIRASLPNYNVLNETFLSQLQEVHDNHEPDEWQVIFSRFQFLPEGRFDLRIPSNELVEREMC